MVLNFGLVEFWILRGELRLNFCGHFMVFINLEVNFIHFCCPFKPADGSKMWFLIKIGGFYKKNCHKMDSRVG